MLNLLAGCSALPGYIMLPGGEESQQRPEEEPYGR
jgi:hypothetical protein